MVRKRMLSRVLQREFIPFPAHPEQPILAVYHGVDLLELHCFRPPPATSTGEDGTAAQKIPPKVYTSG